MQEPLPLDFLLKFGLSALFGFLIGLEREMSSARWGATGQRDFVLFALLGTASAFCAQQFSSHWLILAGFLAVLVLLVAGFWASHRGGMERDTGITTEVAGILTYFLGVLVANGAIAPSIALAIITVVVLSKKEMLSDFRSHVERYELEATLKLAVISFIVLPILPKEPLDGFLTLPMGTIAAVDSEHHQITMTLQNGMTYQPGEQIKIHDSDGRNLGSLEVIQSNAYQLVADYEGENIDFLLPEMPLRAEPGLRFASTMLSAIVPYKVWLIVVLVSFISFVGYVLVKVLGSSAGIGLTGLVGGLASSTVTTLSFAKRSSETPALNRYFAAAVVLASSVMFPRLIVQIAFVNQALMRSVAIPLTVMGATGLIVATFYFLRPQSQPAETASLQLDNPFSLGSALKFAVVFAGTLMVTRLAITYLGDAWLPLVALVSGLTDADAIAFSVSDAQQDGLISLDWASINVMLGALSNTAMKLGLVLVLGHRGLFRQLTGAFAVIGAAGVLTIILYYDLLASTS